jgi:hypothetical protein
VKTTTASPRIVVLLTLAAGAVWIAGCSSTGGKSNASSASATASGSTAASTSSFATRYKTDDGRTIEIGKATAADGGWRFKDPHLEKCWVADGFNFAGIDTLYIAPTLSTAKFNPDEEKVLQLAKENLPVELERSLRKKNIFTHVVTRETDIQAGVRVVRLENTIVEFSKGGGGARFFAGLYGAGQPVLRILGRMMEGDKAVFTFDSHALGHLPTFAGLVWTDGRPDAVVTFKAYDASGHIVGRITTRLGDSSSSGTTAEDRFLGASYSRGIARIVVTASLGDFEIDHLQYGFAAFAMSAVPAPPSLALGAVGLLGAGLARRRMMRALG